MNTIRTCELYNEDNDRVATVTKTMGEWHVECFEHATFKMTIDCSGHSEQYAFDAAENWVNKWGAFNEG